LEESNKIDRQLDDWIDSHAGEIVETAQGLIRIPSVKGEPAEMAPYGVETVRALEFVLDVSRRYGLTTRNLDGHAVHAQWKPANVAENADIVGVLAHVDVVPAGDGWKHPPFGAEIDGEILYGRGAVDDKGPAIAALYAILAVKETGVPLNKRIRLILGADEESGFGCVTHYFAREEMPATGFTPDATFPVVYAEKGISNLRVTFDTDLRAGKLSVKSLSAGLRANMVPDSAEIVLTGGSDDIEKLLQALPPSANVKLNPAGDEAAIAAPGKSAHGSKPEDGINAFAVLIEALIQAGAEIPAILSRAYAWAKDTTGGEFGIAGEDAVAGPLTSNLGIVDYRNGNLNLTFNVRYPVTWTIEDLIERAAPEIEKYGGILVDYAGQKPLYAPETDPLLAVLMNVYRDFTGDNSPPRTMGGGTYARVMRKGVAFGPEFDGASGGAHQPDEHWPVDHMIQSAKIYARALARLASK
jgi:succinyl-diaminopimelate desuccinylase